MEKKPSNIIDHFHGRLYKKEQVVEWDLPISLQEDLNVRNYPYFFLTTSIESEKHGHEHHIHFCLYPTQYEPVILLEVKTPKILPTLLTECLQLVKNEVKNILTSTGFCKTKDLCYFGIFFNLIDTSEERLNEIKDAIVEIEPVRGVKLFKYRSDSKEPMKF